MASKGNSSDRFEQARRTYDGKRYGPDCKPIGIPESMHYTKKIGGDRPNHDLHPERRGGK